MGWRELELIRESGWAEFPPRLAWQPIFYPVLNQSYAEQIAREWNTEDPFSGHCGVVTAFNLPVDFLQQYDVQSVGGPGHDELWVPAAELQRFNSNIQGGIRIVAAFTGPLFSEDHRSELFSIIKPFIR